MNSQSEQRRRVGVAGRNRSKSTKNLDDFFARQKNSNRGNNPQDDCDISLCTATTNIDPRKAKHCTWKRNKEVATPYKQKPKWTGGFASLSQRNTLNQGMMLMQVKEESSSAHDEGERKYGGVTLGIANLLYKPQFLFTVNGGNGSGHLEKRSEVDSCRRPDGLSTARSEAESTSTEKSEVISLGRQSVSCTFSSTATDESSIEVTIPHMGMGYEVGLHGQNRNEILYEKVRLAEETCIQEEARLENQKRLIREKQLADEVRLVEMTKETKACHVEKNKCLSKLAKEAKLAENHAHLPDSIKSVLAKIEEERRIAQNLKIKEEKFLKEEEMKLAERRRLIEEAYQVEEARLARQTRDAEARLLEQALLAEERHQAEERRLVDIKKRVKEARQKAKEARRLVEQEMRLMDSLTFDETFSYGGDKLQALSEERSWEAEDTTADFEDGARLSQQHWKEMDAKRFDVRGKSYLTDRRKVASAPNLLRLVTVDFVQVKEPRMGGFCSDPMGRVQKMLQLEKQRNRTVPDAHKMPAFIFCMNMVLPGPPHYHLVMYFAVDDLDKLGLNNHSRNRKTQRQYSKSLYKFLFGESDQYRNQVLKMIPRISEGSFLLKAAVGAKPFILGKYLTQRFVREDRYLEAIIDVSSSPSTQKLLRLSSVYKNPIVAGISFVLEASDEESLPENIMCSVELNNKNFDGEIPLV